MSLELFHWPIVIYIAGVLVCSLSCLQFMFYRSQLKKNRGIDLFQTRPDLKRYLILKPFLWPYFVITERSPIERISELFFKHYGDEGHTYFRDQGIKNFLRDVLKGKKRYKNYQVNRLIWPVEKQSSDFSENKTHVQERGKPVYAEILYAHYQNKYLLRVVSGSKECFNNETSVSRFQLDQCKLMVFSDFQQRLLEINHDRAMELLQKFQ